MADIFISYSRRDSEAALALAERLRASGASVWIDTAALTAAETWSAEIVNAINSCKTFIILLSPDSVASHNVTKELSLASEKRKTILPIVITKCKLNEAMEYALAGLQRVNITDEESLERAFAKLGITGNGFSQTVNRPNPSKKRSSLVFRSLAFALVLCALIASYFLFFKKTATEQTYGFQSRKLAVLPFENLGSPQDENVTDGITTEVIHTLAQLFGISVTDRKTVMAYKGKKVDSKTAAQELGVDCILGGTVQVSGKNIRVTAELLDIKKGKVLFSEQFDGSIDDVLSLQERMGQAIGFEIQYALVQRDRIAHRYPLPKDPQALELRMKAAAMLESATSNQDIEKIKKLLDNALELEPEYVGGLAALARYYQKRFEVISHDTSDLAIADSLALVAQKMDTSAHYIHRTFYDNARLRNDTIKAEYEAKELIRLLPNDPYSYAILGNYYSERRRWDAAVDINTLLIKRDISNFGIWRSLIIAYDMLKDTAGHNRTIREYLPLLSRYLSKNESDAEQRVQSGYYYALLGKHDEAVAELKKALVYEDKWGNDEYYHSACAYARVGEWDRAIDKLAHSIIIRPGNMDAMKTDPDFRELVQRPNVEERIRARVEEIKKNKR